MIGGTASVSCVIGPVYCLVWAFLLATVYHTVSVERRVVDCMVLLSFAVRRTSAPPWSRRVRHSGAWCYGALACPIIITVIMPSLPWGRYVETRRCGSVLACFSTTPRRSRLVSPKTCKYIKLSCFVVDRYCLAGLGITSVVFPKHIALLGMLQLALGDPVAALFGHATRSVK